MHFLVAHLQMTNDLMYLVFASKRNIILVATSTKKLTAKDVNYQCHLSKLPSHNMCNLQSKQVTMLIIKGLRWQNS